MKPTDDLKRPSVDQLIEKIEAVDLFSNLQDTIRRDIAQQIKIVELAPNEILVRQGEDARSLYFLLEGRLSVILKDESGAERVVADLPKGSIVGEIALVVGGRRSATVVGAEASTLGVLTAAALTRLMKLHPVVASSIVSMASRRLREGQLALHLVGLYQDFDPTLIKEFQKAVDWVTLAAGEPLFHRGDPADACYLVVSGRLRTMPEDDSDGQPFLGHDATPGDIVGDLPMILEEAHRITMAAVRETEIARIPRSAFEDWVERRPRMMLNLVRTAFRSDRSPALAPDRPEKWRRSIAVVSLDDGLDLGPILQRIEKKLAGYGDTIILLSEKVDTLLHIPGISQSVTGSPANIRLLQWLDEIEKAHCYVVYVADCRQCEWSHRVIRQADHVLFVAEASGDERLREIELNHRLQFEKDPLRSSLLLLHAADTARPSKTARWLDQRSVAAVYHLRRGNDKDLDRLTRILAGRAISLVLGGGGARGFAHLGVLRALEELGVPVDMVGGTSVGAPIAIAPAQGMDAAQSQVAVSEAFRSLLDYTLPVVSMLSGRRITRNIEDYALSWDIEDLWLPYFCVTTNITKARSVVHRRGNLARAVRASVSIPGVLPPVSFGGDLHVDGGILDNLPIDIMRKLNPTGTILAVDVLPPSGPKARSDYPLGLSGLRVLFSRFLPWLNPIRVPSIGSTILASMTIGSAGALKRMIDDRLADLYLNINVKGVPMLKFKKVAQIADIGYQQSIAPLRQWAASKKGLWR